jgi:hypothetical protein
MVNLPSQRRDPGPADSWRLMLNGNIRCSNTECPCRGSIIVEGGGTMAVITLRALVERHRERNLTGD